MTVLILTRESIGVDGVVDALGRRGVRSVVLQTDRIPHDVALSWHGGRLTIARDGQRETLDDLSAIWYRRMAVRPDLPEGTDPAVLRAVAEEIGSFLRGILAAAPVPVFQPKWHMDHVDLRPRQLSIAAAVGLDVPRTITSSNLEAARAFVEGCGGRAITKMITGAVLPEPGAPPRVMMTTPVDDATLAAMSPEELRLCPATFQEHLVKRAEHRVTVVGSTCFVACLPGLDGTVGETDWRRDGAGVVDQWRAAELPREVTDRLLALMDRLQLDYGAADVIETVDGRYVFLEVNPAGEYLWLEPHFGDAVREALADLLSGRTPSRLHGAWA